MDNQMNGLKEIYDCVIKATYDIEIDGKKISIGEPIVAFKKLQLVDFQEVKKRFNATGGYNNQTFVSWESTKEEQISFSQGVFSKVHLAILGNADLDKKNNIEVPKYEEGELDEQKKFQLKYTPIQESLFVYNAENGEKVNFVLENNTILCDTDPYTNIQAYYNFIYADEAHIINVGKQLIKGYVELTAKTRLKDDRTGKIVTGIFKIPKMKLMSDFSIRLGNDAAPAIGNFRVNAFPTGSKGSEKVMEIILLSDDIDSDL